MFFFDIFLRAQYFVHAPNIGRILFAPYFLAPLEFPKFGT